MMVARDTEFGLGWLKPLIKEYIKQESQNIDIKTLRSSYSLVLRYNIYKQASLLMFSLWLP